MKQNRRPPCRMTRGRSRSSPAGRGASVRRSSRELDRRRVPNRRRRRERQGHCARRRNRRGAAGLLIPLQLSITDRDAVEAAMTRLAAEHGPIRALINNAGMTLPATFLDQTDEDWDRIVDVNLKGTFVMSQVVARQMVDEKTGSIVNISSVSAHGVRTGPPAYAAAKAGVEGLSRLMAVQLGTARHPGQHGGGRHHSHPMAAVPQDRQRDRADAFLDADRPDR